MTNSIRVLIAESDETAAENLRQTLTHLGFSVQAVARTGEQAVEQARTHRPDVVVINVSLGPGMNGIDAAKTMSGELPVPAVFISPRSDAGVMDRVTAFGGSAFLLKPFDPRELDITIRLAHERHRTEQKLLESEARFRNLFNGMPVGLYVAAEDGRVLEANPALARMFGYEDVQGAIGMNIQSIYAHPEERQGFLAELKASGQVADHEIEAIRPDGSTLWLSASAKAARNADGRIVSYEGSLTDITKRLDLEKNRRELAGRILQEQKDRSILTLAGGVAHQFNNALTVVLGNIELLQMRVSGKSEKEYLSHIQKASEDMAELTRQLLGYAQGGRFIPRPLAILPEISRALGVAMRGRVIENIRVVNDRGENIWPVLADVGQITQVLVNIMANAVESMEGTGGTLHIQTENVTYPQDWSCNMQTRHRAGDYVRIRISDTGGGVPEEYRNRIFDPFFTTKFTGRGLGLAASLGIVRNHGGCLNIERSGSEGSIFTILLPRQTTAGAVISRAVHPHESRPVTTILLVDDDARVLKLMETILKTHDAYTILLASGGIEALSQFKENMETLSMIVLDVMLPDMSGQEVYEEIKAVRPKLPILMTSGYDEATALSRLQLQENDGFLGKPFSAPSFLKKVESLLQSSSTMSSRNPR